MHIQDPQLLLQPLKPVAGQFPTFYAKTKRNMETPEQKTLNNALVSTNEVYNNAWKYSRNHAPSHK